jgi:Flp pilus assembly protein TadG
MHCHAAVTPRKSSCGLSSGRRDAAGDGTPMRQARRAGAGGDDGERGALSLMIVVLFVALVALAGIVVDGGAKLDADQRAYALAQEAARAGATSVDASSAYKSGAFVVDPQQALAAASSYLTEAGEGDFTVRAVGSREIWVRVTISQPTTFLALIGISRFTCTGRATASLVTGVTGGR